MPLPVIATIQEALAGMRHHAGFLAALTVPFVLAFLAETALLILAVATAGEGFTPDAFERQQHGLGQVALRVLQLWLSLVLSLNVAQLVLSGRDRMGAPLREAIRLGRREVTAFAVILVTTLLVGLVSAGVVAVPMLIGGLVQGDQGQEAGGAIGGLLAIVAAIWVLLRLSLALPGVAAGDGFAALRRSWQLTRGSVLRLLGLFLLATLVTLIAMLLLVLVGGLALAAIGVIVALAADLPGGVAALSFGFGALLGAGATQLASSIFFMAIAAIAYRTLGGDSPAPARTLPDAPPPPPDDAPSPQPPPAPETPQADSRRRVPRTSFGQKPPPGQG